MKKKRKSIVMQTIYRVSAVFIFAFILLSVLFTCFIGSYMKSRIMESQSSQMDMITNNMDVKMNSLIESMIALSEYTPAVRLVSGYHELYTKEWLDNIRSVDDYLQNVNMFTDYLIDVNLLNARGETVYSLNDILKSDFDYTHQSWFQEALRQDGLVKYTLPHGMDHMYAAQRSETFSIIYPISGAQQELGYIFVECDLAKIADFLQQRGDYANYILLDDQKRVIFSNQKEVLIPEALQEDVITGENHILQDKAQYYIINTIPVNNWRLILSIDRDMLLYPVRKLVLYVFLIGVTAIALLMIVAVNNGKNMEKSFAVLLSRINSYQGEELAEAETYEDAPYEIAEIGIQFEKMAVKTNHLIQEVYVSGMKQKEAELEALINQINPHFLYNVFQLIQTKAVLADNREIEDMIQNLSQMLRYTMERKKDKVLVQEELAYIRNYLTFYKERFPNLFEYQIDCREELLQCRMIKFILQPIVENCFKHAFVEQKSGYDIHITVESKGDELIFIVEDNGAGIDAFKLREIKDKLEANVSDRGIGIENTNERIHLVYGHQYGLHIESRVHEYTRVVMNLKREG